MKDHTTWKIGGPADLWLQPQSLEELLQALQMGREKGGPIYVLGGGSNLLVADEGLHGTVIQLGNSLREIRIDGTVVTAEAGVPLPFLAVQAAEAGLSGLEFAAGIPGTVGGAVVMNAGAYQSQISNVIRRVICCTLDGQLLELGSDQCQFSYRNSRFRQSRELIVAAVELELQPGDKAAILEQMQRNTAARREKQPINYPNAGSIFKNPPGDAAGRLIELAGAKGWRQGGAVVSEKHANFIVNAGGATCDDVLQLIQRIKTAVWEKTGVHLEEEILVLGRENI